MLEFLANWPERGENNNVFIRRKRIPVTSNVINMILGLDNFEDSEEQLLEEERQGINWGRFSHVLGYPGYYIPEYHIMMRNQLNNVAKVWNIFLGAHCLPTKNMARVEYYKLKYIYAIRRGYNIDVGKMIISSLDHITQAFYAGGVGLSGGITDICTVNGIPGVPTDVYQISGKKVCPATLEIFFAMPRHRDEMVVREEEPEEENMNRGDEEDEPQGQQAEQQMPQQPMPPPHMLGTGQYDQNFGYLFQQNEYIIGALQHQFQVNAHFNWYHTGLADDINEMAARLNINERVRRPDDLPEFHMRPPRNPFQNDEEDD